MLDYKDSNLERLHQKQLCYHYTIIQYCSRRPGTPQSLGPWRTLYPNTSEPALVALLGVEPKLGYKIDSNWLYQESGFWFLSASHTIRESGFLWALQLTDWGPILSVYPCDMSLHICQSTLCTNQFCSPAGSRTRLSRMKTWRPNR